MVPSQRMQWASRAGPSPHLAEFVTPALLAEHVGVGYADVVVADLGMAAATAHGRDVAHDLEAGRVRRHDEGAVAGLGDLGVGIGLGDDDGEVRTVGTGREPLVAVDDPLVAVANRRSLDLRRIGTRDFRLRHGEAGPRGPFAERLQPLVLLLVRAEMQQGVHVAFVRRLAVDEVRPHVGLHRLRRHRRHGGDPEPHATPLLRHMRCPETLVSSRLAQILDRLAPLVARCPAARQFRHLGPCNVTHETLDQ